MRWLVAAIALLTTAVPVLAELIDFEDDFDSYGEGDEYSSNPNQDAFAFAWPAVCNSLQVDNACTGDCPDGFLGWDPPFYVEHGKDSLQ